MLSEKIKNRREELGLTQEELGQKVGLTKAAICRYEKNLVVNPKRSMIAKLAKALECDPVWLIDLTPSPGVAPERPSIIELTEIASHLSDDDIAFLINMARRMEDKS